MNENRVARVRDNLARRGLTQALIVDPLSIWWLCGYYTEPYERFLALLLPAEGTPTLFANRLFPDAGGCGARVVEFSDTDDPVALVAEATDRSRALGVDKELAARWLVPLMEAGAASSFVLASDAVDDARSIKDAREQELMRAASATNDAAMAWLVDQVRPGVTERQIADGLLGEYRRLGAGGHSFSPIVSFGANAADPHHMPDDTRLQAGDCIVLDIGGKKAGYCSDMTRTYFCRTVSDKHAAIHDLVRRANEAAEALVRPGVPLCAAGALHRPHRARAGGREQRQYHPGAGRNDLFHRARRLPARRNGRACGGPGPGHRRRLRGPQPRRQALPGDRVRQGACGAFPPSAACGPTALVSSGGSECPGRFARPGQERRFYNAAPQAIPRRMDI